MFYAARGSVPHTAAHPASRADGSLYAEELFGVEGFTGRSSLLYHLVPPTRTHRIEPGATDRARGGRRRLPPPSADQDAAGVRAAGDAVTGRIPLFFNNDIVMGVVRPADAMPDGTFYRNGEADELLFVHEGAGSRHDLRAAPLRARATTSSCRSARRGGSTRTRGSDAADALSRVPVGDRAAEALSQRLRPAARARAVLAARHPRARRGPAADRRGRLRGPRQDARPADRLPLPPPPVRRRRLGRLPLAVRASTSATSSRSPAASTSRRRSTRRSRPGTSSCARSCRASSTTTRSRSRRRTTTRTSTATRSSTTSPATS